ncbi:hypothetical protein D4S03_08120 [bacterium]|nr:MAG: hypothetical protein D4S03_08120 [bacterium]
MFLVKKFLLIAIAFIIGGILFSTPTLAVDCASGLTCTSRTSCLAGEFSCIQPGTEAVLCCIDHTPTPTPKIEPVPVIDEACPGDGTIYPPNSNCYAKVNKVETLGANLVDSNEGFLSYPLTCITAPKVTYKETYTTDTPLPSPTPTPIYKEVNVGTDISNAQLGFLGPDSTTLATSNPDKLAQKYLFNALFDRPGADPNAQRESFRTFWRMLDNLSQAQLKAYYIQNFDKHVYYYVDKDYIQKPIKISDLKTKLPNCLKNFGIVADILGCWKNDKYLDQYIQLGIEDPEAREAYDALLPFDFNNSRSYLSNEQPFSGISEENIPYLQAILSGLKGYQNSIPGLFDYYTPESARKNLALYPILPSYELLSLQYPIIKIVSAINKNNCSVPAKSSSLSSPKTYPTNPITYQTIGVPVTPVLIDSKPDKCICDPESTYCIVRGQRDPTLCTTYSNNETKCKSKYDRRGYDGCIFIKGEYTYELTGNATGFPTTVFNNPKITNLTDLIVGGKPLLSNTSDSEIINLINLISDKLISPVQPSFYKMLLPSFAPDPEKTFVSAPVVNTTASTANSNATVSVSGGNTIYRENNLAQDTMHFLQNCWLVPSDQQSSSKCGALSTLPTPDVGCDIDAPETSSIGITKDVFVRLADGWYNSSNMADECFNDVTNRSLCAGINPMYSLMMWLHESDASNYTMNWSGPVEDFGIHMAGVSAENFNEQITKFLTLDPGAHCLSDPRINGNYWLGWMTNMLNGSCDPDEKNSFSGMTGREALPLFVATWEMLAGIGTPMPTTIHVSQAGQSCP